MRLQGKVAIITGSTKGIGRAVAIGYAEEGATVIVCGRSEDLAKNLASELTSKGKKAVAPGWMSQAFIASTRWLLR